MLTVIDTAGLYKPLRKHLMEYIIYTLYIIIIVNLRVCRFEGEWSTRIGKHMQIVTDHFTSTIYPRAHFPFDVMLYIPS
ncbi:hypothetical protein DM02DRAFT_396029 [Periconia macrospinosa]|uniref:Uncharacterized protein n=1 Tax=Periconia macrospinosa TaxID=97972 RepID=A0A2V1DR07_9PLEO|nr:hypothetical protein DM02DRAFT_396029 [Periconia macrospinosa]